MCTPECATTNPYGWNGAQKRGKGVCLVWLFCWSKRFTSLFLCARLFITTMLRSVVRLLSYIFHQSARELCLYHFYHEKLMYVETRTWMVCLCIEVWLWLYSPSPYIPTDPSRLPNGFYTTFRIPRARVCVHMETAYDISPYRIAHKGECVCLVKRFLRIEIIFSFFGCVVWWFVWLFLLLLLSFLRFRSIPSEYGRIGVRERLRVKKTGVFLFWNQHPQLRAYRVRDNFRFVLFDAVHKCVNDGRLRFKHSNYAFRLRRRISSHMRNPQEFQN